MKRSLVMHLFGNVTVWEGNVVGYSQSTILTSTEVCIAKDVDSANNTSDDSLVLCEIIPTHTMGFPLALCSHAKENVSGCSATKSKKVTPCVIE